MYFVYIVASHSRVLYVGMTNDLLRRMVEHRTGAIPGFAQRFKANRLVYYHASDNVSAVIAREKQLKGWKPSRKMELVEAQNPGWEDLSVSIGLGVLERADARTGPRW
ncbi:MAG TPA: GIY-YIG nuclease family protein [Longimicrobium sp.]|uniref:GIY-YIG nuclease family protein n=1 Tax=Longimicrobium sp. TaxID=2029185 RepID=UPI002ED7E23D